MNSDLSLLESHCWCEPPRLKAWDREVGLLLPLGFFKNLICFMLNNITVLFCRISFLEELAYDGVAT